MTVGAKFKLKMSTFSGYVQEIPHISVDNFEEFNRNSKMFFLSHCHTDHMKGLNDDNSRNTLFGNLNVYLYASPVSVRILRNKYRDLAMQLKELPIEIPTLIKAPSNFGDKDKYLTVTTIPAGHCPGSVMFLFETEDKNVLYTGDFRINTKDLHKYKAFHDCAGQVKRIDAMYLDTTFCSPLYEHFSSREESMREICRLVEEWINVSDKHIVNLSMGASYGSEYLFMEIFKCTNEPIHAISEMYNLYKYMPDMAKVMTTNKHNAKVHTRQSYYNTCCNIIEESNYFVRHIRPTAMVWDFYKPQQDVVREETEYSYRVCYSSHASCSEIKEFVRYLKPHRIEPCVVPENLEDKEKLISLLSEMINGYKIINAEKKCEEIEQFSLNITDNKEDECIRRKSKLDLLSSPPRKFKRSRFTSTSSDS